MAGFNISLLSPGMNASLASDKSAIEIVELVFLSLEAILICFCNCLVILAFAFGPGSIRTFTNYFVVNLAVSDLMVGCISLPLWIISRYDYSLVSGKIYDILTIPLDVLCGITSILNLTSISLEKLVAVKFPVAHMALSKCQVIFAIGITWIIGITFAALKYVATVYQFFQLYTACIFTLGFMVPLVIIIASYCVIFYVSADNMKAANNHGIISQELHIVKTISLIIGLFVICWAPFFILNMVYAFCGHCSVSPWLVPLSKIMHYSNSMMNFFIYGVRFPTFRNFFKKILCPWGNSRPRNSNNLELNTTGLYITSENSPRQCNTDPLLQSQML